MSDDTSKTGAGDRSRISLGEPHEVRYWTKTLGIDEARLRDVVKRVGPSAAKVRLELGMKEEPIEGDGGPTGSGGVASESPSPGPTPRRS